MQVSSLTCPIQAQDRTEYSSSIAESPVRTLATHCLRTHPPSYDHCVDSMDVLGPYEISSSSVEGARAASTNRGSEDLSRMCGHCLTSPSFLTWHGIQLTQGIAFATRLGFSLLISWSIKKKSPLCFVSSECPQRHFDRQLILGFVTLFEIFVSHPPLKSPKK